MGINDALVRPQEDLSPLSIKANNRGGLIIKRSLHLNIDQTPLIDTSRAHPPFHNHNLDKKIHSNKLKNSRHVFRSTGANNKRLRGSQRMRYTLDDRLKRFRMLDPDEFKEMLNTLSQQMPQDHSKGPHNLDTIGGMQVENYWSRK